MRGCRPSPASLGTPSLDAIARRHCTGQALKEIAAAAGGIMNEKSKKEVLEVYAKLGKAFIENDMETINAHHQYPLAHIRDGYTILVNEYPFNPVKLMAEKQWHTSINFESEVVFASDDKAHIILRHATRVRKDGTPIETVSGFYALTRMPSGWKVFAVSDIAVPA